MFYFFEYWKMLRNILKLNCKICSIYRKGEYLWYVYKLFYLKKNNNVCGCWIELWKWLNIYYDIFIKKNCIYFNIYSIMGVDIWFY